MPDSAPGQDAAAIREAVRRLLDALGLDAAAEPELAATPERVADFWREALAGHAAAPELVTFARAGGDDELVLVRDIEFHSLCVHHLVPFFGRASVAYLPAGRLVGVSGIARLIEHHARRVQLQERLGRGVADDLERVLRPRGLAVILEARHLCMEMRGVRRPGVVETRIVRGALAEPHWLAALPAAGRGRG